MDSAPAKVYCNTCKHFSRVDHTSQGRCGALGNTYRDHARRKCHRAGPAEINGNLNCEWYEGALIKPIATFVFVILLLCLVGWWLDYLWEI